MSVARGMSTGRGDTSLASQAPANRFITWLLRYLHNSNHHMSKNNGNVPAGTAFVLCCQRDAQQLCLRHAGNVPRNSFSHKAFRRVCHPKLFGHEVKGIEGVNGELDENRTRCSRLSNGQRSSHGGYDVSDSPDGRTELTQGLEERHLVNVLQGSPALSHMEDGRVRQRSSGRTLFARVMTVFTL